MGETTVGILAVQGAFAEHECALCALGVRHFQIRQKRDLQRPMDALILPGGESTVMGKLLRELDLFKEIRRRILHGLPVMGTCAGLILLAREVEGDSAYLGTMDIRVKRNAYGRQLGSFYPCAVHHESFGPGGDFGESRRKNRRRPSGPSTGSGLSPGGVRGFADSPVFFGKTS